MKTKKKNQEFSSFCEYKKVFFPKQTQQNSGKEEDPFQIGINIAREILAKCKKN